MGNYTSKLFSHHHDDNKMKLPTTIKLGVMEKNQPCTPIMTKKPLTADPRSATAEIVRTPIEAVATPTGPNQRIASAIPKYLRTKQYLETDIDSVLTTINPETELFDPRSPNVDHQRTPISINPPQNYLTPIVHVQQALNMDTPENTANGLDPRSPATDFDRTPIMKPKSPKLPNLSQENGEEKGRISKSQIAYCETTIDLMPEIQVLPEIISHKSSMISKRLYLSATTDNQLDNTSDNKFGSDESDPEDQVTVIQNVRSVSNIELTNSPAKENNQKEMNRNIVEPTNISKKLFTESEEKIRVWRDSISPEILSEQKTEGFAKREEIMIEFDENQLVHKSNQLKTEVVSSKVDENLRNKASGGKKKKSHQSRKDNKIVFEDVKAFNGDGATVSANKNRTPLANRSNSHHKVENLTKSPQHLLRNKCLSTQSQQQENTPPRSKQSSKKANFTHWDMDKTVII
ncbi:uncharacterized protein [Chelonus insularis]|uniref:uncharacterized protein n=1 Tax=Chelonus insularis TaxID=460826 RepID=UPI00158A44CA|nr:uncharacterized protein LOC118064898 [Chelonus insularis]